MPSLSLTLSWARQNQTLNMSENQSVNVNARVNTGQLKAEPQKGMVMLVGPFRVSPAAMARFSHLGRITRAGSTSISRLVPPMAPSASLVPGMQDAPVGAVWTFMLPTFEPPGEPRSKVV
mmetsp:Transcript_42218/g.121268  ORF Transcript_42218/g.121268 Transcript_42218/m.121268 type:complete len:120 (+) Transcript_42218:263-622(+)